MVQQLLMTTTARENGSGVSDECFSPVRYMEDVDLGCGWGLALYSSGVALLLLLQFLHSLICKSEDWHLACDSVCFVQDFGCSMERISSGQRPHGGT